MGPDKPASGPPKAVSPGGNDTCGLSGLFILESVMERLRASKIYAAISALGEIFRVIGGIVTAETNKTPTADDLAHQEPTAGSSDTTDDLSRLRFQHALATAYLKDNQVSKAIPIFEHVIAVRNKHWTPDYPQLLRSQYFLAQAYHANGQAEIATRLLQKIVDIQRTSMSENHQYRIDSERLLKTWVSIDPVSQPTYADCAQTCLPKI